MVAAPVRRASDGRGPQLAYGTVSDRGAAVREAVRGALTILVIEDGFDFVTAVWMVCAHNCKLFGCSRATHRHRNVVFHALMFFVLLFWLPTMGFPALLKVSQLRYPFYIPPACVWCGVVNTSPSSSSSSSLSSSDLVVLVAVEPSGRRLGCDRSNKEHPTRWIERSESCRVTVLWRPPTVVHF